MLVKEVMTEKVHFVSPESSIEDAAKIMAESDCGFLAVMDIDDKSLRGVVTDRDIVVRAVARGMSSQATKVSAIQSGATFSCFANQDLEDAAEAMRQKCVYRLLVFNNNEEQQLCGVISLGDISRNNQERLAGDVAHSITEKVA